MIHHAFFVVRLRGACRIGFSFLGSGLDIMLDRGFCNAPVYHKVYMRGLMLRWSQAGQGPSMVTTFSIVEVEAVNSRRLVLRLFEAAYRCSVPDEGMESPIYTGYTNPITYLGFRGLGASQSAQWISEFGKWCCGVWRGTVASARITSGNRYGRWSCGITSKERTAMRWREYLV